MWWAECNTKARQPCEDGSMTEIIEKANNEDEVADEEDPSSKPEVVPSSEAEQDGGDHTLHCTQTTKIGPHRIHNISC